MDKNVFGIVIVTYNPQTKDNLNDKINEYTKVCSKVVVVDNNSKQTPKILNNEFVMLISNSENYGIAKALNIGCSYLIKEKCTHALLLDQDSIIDNESILRLQNCMVETEYAIVGPQILAGDLAERPTFLIRTKHWFKKCTVDENKVSEVYINITSGSLLDLSVWQKVGGFRNDLFIEKVDDEFAIRLHRLKYKIAVVGNAYLFQSYGESKVIKRFGLTWHPTFHEPWRLKLLYRNKMILLKEYFFSEFPFVVFQELALLKRFITILLIEDKKIKKICAIVSGTVLGTFKSKKHLNVQD